jgi:hypothetical protein
MWNNVVVVYLFVKCASKTGGRGVDILMVGGKMKIMLWFIETLKGARNDLCNGEMLK